MQTPALSSIAATAFLASHANAALYDQVIKTQYGNVVGYPAFNSSPTGVNLTQWKDITVFKGIPFAASTAGNSRWRQPQPVTAWNSTLYASDFGPVCPSAVSNSNYTISEDCLSLNIWSAANSTNASLPVVMWSYPAESTARDALFDGGGMADKNIVFVNYNYRTGSFGWMGHPELSAEMLATTGYNVSGNWGVYDQFAALKWIKENIQNFGGNPDHVTVMGQSAGSAATYHILNSPLTKGQIVGAIIESGVRDPLSTSLAEGYISLSTNVAQGPTYLSSVNASTIAEARALPYTSLVTGLSTFGSSSSYSWTACLDYYALPGTYLEILQNGSANQVPVLTGSTKDESGATYGLNITLDTYLSDLNSTYNGTWVDKFLAAYPANDSVTASGAYNSQFTDRSVVGTYLWAQLWKEASVQPVYNYIWDHAPPGQDRGAYHESEINYVLNNLYDTDSPWTSTDYSIAKTMNGYWANFIKSGNPNGVGMANWTVVTASTSQIVQRVGDGFGPVPIADEGKVELFEEWFDSLIAY